MKQLITLNVNGGSYEVAVDSHRTLLEVLRTELGLTGAKEGCDMGECGSCTVLMEGEPGIRAAGFFGLDWTVEQGEWVFF